MLDNPEEMFLKFGMKREKRTNHYQLLNHQ